MKKSLFFGIALFAVSLTLFSCSSDDVYNESKQGELQYQKRMAEYNAAFIQKFGTIASGHSWGFKTGTRAAATGNYGNYAYELPAEIKNNVGKDFAKPFNKENNNVDTMGTLPYQNYFVQHVYKQTGNGSGSYQGSDTHHKLLQLQAYNYNTGEWEDVTNFKGGKDVHHMTDAAGNKLTKGVTLMVNMGTPTSNQPMFRWIHSDGFVCNNYVIKVINGEYYLGLGYDNKDMKHYDAWIIKLSEAHGRPEYKERGRIMCEDLGSIGDFDFNDVVFDATIYNDGSINIEILAAGGTLPISVAGVPVTLGQMVNTGVNNTEETQTIFISAAKAAEKNWYTLKDIPVKVTDSEGYTFELDAKYGEAPGKICTFIGLPWADEYVPINEAYPNFSTWVRAENPELWWEEHIDEEFCGTLTDLDLSNNPRR